MATLRCMKAGVILLVYLTSGCHDTLAKCKPKKGACPTDWTLWGGNCYKAITTTLTWTEAGDECKREGGVMAVPNSLAEGLFMGSMANDIWINCNDKENEGEWICTDGVTQSYSNWASGEPNNDQQGEDCVYMPNANGKWLDIPCDKQRKTVCKQPVFNNNTVPGP